MRGKYNPQKVKRHFTYTVNEIRILFGNHERTVLRWISLEGLAPVEGTRNPYLIHGDVLRSFLEERRKKKKVSLQPDEFYCVKCRMARKSRPECVQIIKTGIKMGHDKLTGRKTGICEICGGRINRFFVYPMDEQTHII